MTLTLTLPHLTPPQDLPLDLTPTVILTLVSPHANPTLTLSRGVPVEPAGVPQAPVRGVGETTAEASIAILNSPTLTQP